MRSAFCEVVVKPGPDVAFLHFLNQFAGQHPLFDRFIVGISTNYLVKGGVLMTLLWGLWFQKSGDVRRRRERLMLTLASAVFALVAVRALLAVLPHRSRPLHDPDVVFQVPVGLKLHTLDYASSFPSDHAALFVALAAGLLMVNRRIGLVALLYVLAFVCFPRMYLGLHFLSDIAAGSAVGVTAAMICFHTPPARWCTQLGNFWQDRAPATFHAALFFLSWQIACMFDPVRQMLDFAAGALGH